MCDKAVLFATLHLVNSKRGCKLGLQARLAVAVRRKQHPECLADSLLSAPAVSG